MKLKEARARPKNTKIYNGCARLHSVPVRSSNRRPDSVEMVRTRHGCRTARRVLNEKGATQTATPLLYILRAVYISAIYIPLFWSSLTQDTTQFQIQPHLGMDKASRTESSVGWGRLVSAMQRGRGSVLDRLAKRVSLWHRHLSEQGVLERQDEISVV